MAFKFLACFAALLAFASAGVYDAHYSHAPAVSYSSVAQAAPAHYAHAAPAYGYAAAPAVHASYHAGPAVHHAYAAPAVHHTYAAPAVHHAYAAAPVVAKVAAPIYAKTIVEDHHAPANYEFEYSVHDPHTGDAKSQKEVRHGDAVHGSYSLVDADGSKRTVEYTADAHNGFNAVVHKEPAAHPVVAKVAAAPIAYAAPAAYGYAHAPAAYGHYHH